MNLRQRSIIDKCKLKFGSEVVQDDPLYYQELEFWNINSGSYVRTWSVCRQPTLEEASKIDKNNTVNYAKRFKKVTNKKFIQRLVNTPKLYIRVESENDVYDNSIE